MDKERLAIDMAQCVKMLVETKVTPDTRTDKQLREVYEAFNHWIGKLMIARCKEEKLRSLAERMNP